MNIYVNIIKTMKTNLIPTINKFFNKAFSDKYLLYTNVGISVSLSGLGDVLEQHYEMVTGQLSTNQWDAIRTRNMSCSGATVGILCHYWYKFLDRSLPGYTLRIVLKKILVDQIVGSPLCISTFFVTLALVEGSSLENFTEEVKQKAWKLYTAEWIIWPSAQFVNFYFLSTKYRVLFDNTVSLGYDVYTSKVKHSPVLNNSNNNNNAFNNNKEK